ncbi:DUF1295 domain-containing protein [Spirochaeta isovalerica]|uniref:Steroid 5-alpha reductase family enzyme n=1 Tax=Spirochaeta isovalerica TaxID=150 RepID=A0A841R9V6_9SPIO|nr:DUF1295 domain-containing protein [Spirochaeta isovalerica]MBB6480027.1 steroid 5-alpha reductase family enzyme [Spirochaeta isovalerica]
MNKIKSSKSLSMIFILIAYGTASGAGWFAWQAVPADMPLLLKTLIADLSASGIIFLFSLISGNSSCYDAFWSVAPPVLFLIWTTSGQLNQDISLRAVFLLSVTLLWALRLTANWALSWPGLNHEDWRFISLRESTGPFYWIISLIGLHLFPTLLVFISSVPAYFVLTSLQSPLNFMDFIALGTALTAVFFEWLSDFQLAGHRKSADKETPIRRGLWKYSRHPNYFGEVLFWFSLYFFSLAAVPEKFWIGFAPLLMLCQFVFVSIPIMEKRQLQRKKGYDEIREKVSMFFPLPPGKSSL